MNRVSLVLVLAVLIMTYGLLAQQEEVTFAQTATVTTVTKTETAGTVSEFSPDTIVVRSETGSSPSRYSYTESTTYVDDTGAAVSRETVKSGLPVTVYYTGQGDRTIANKVVVRKTMTTTERPVIEEKRSTTMTTETK